MKQCTACGEKKPPTEFYHRSGKCKPCYRARVKAYRLKNIDRIRAYDRDRGLRNDPNVYRTSERMRAHNAIKRAVDSGKIERWPCQVCGDIDSHAHHVSYAKGMELAVTWLCPPHHKQTHVMTANL